MAGILRALIRRIVSFQQAAPAHRGRAGGSDVEIFQSAAGQVVDSFILELRNSASPAIRNIALAVTICQSCPRRCPGPDVCHDFVAAIRPADAAVSH
jgi:hypothetical protein